MRTVAVALLSLLAPCAAAITNGHVPSILDHRFDAVAAFAVSWRLGFDQGSHADDADHAWFCSATLVNVDKILVARHCLDAYGQGATYMARFRRHLDGSLGTVAAGVSSFHHVRISSWTAIGAGVDGDWAIGQLEDDVTHITPIPMTNAAWAVPRGIVQAGWGRQGPGTGEGPATELFLCDNRLGSTIFNGAGVTYPSPDIPDYGTNPCGVNNWDSGGPALTFDGCGYAWVIASHSSVVYGTLVTTEAIVAAGD